MEQVVVQIYLEVMEWKWMEMYGNGWKMAYCLQSFSGILPFQDDLQSTKPDLGAEHVCLRRIDLRMPKVDRFEGIPQTYPPPFQHLARHG